jgi:thiol-disulfide isomerase/thioredoxin
MAKLMYTIGLYLTILISGSSLYANEGFTIQGNIIRLADHSIVRLYDMDKGTVVDSSLVVNGSFSLEGAGTEIPKPYALQIANEQLNHFIYLYFGNENIRITGTTDDIPNKLVVKGSLHNDIKSALDRKLSGFEVLRNQRNNEMRKLYQEGKLNDSIKEAYLGKEGIMKKLNDDVKIAEKEFIRQNSNNYYTLYLLNLYKTNYYTDAELRDVYKSLSSKMKKTKDAKAIKKHIDSPALANGEKYIDATALDRKGNTTTFKDFFDGKYVLLNFSSPSCQNSVDSLPMLVDLCNNNSGKVNIVTYCTDASKENFEMFSDTKYHPWTFVWNTEGNYSDAYLKYRIGATPTFFLFSKDGKLIDTWKGYDNTTHQKILGLIN